MCKTFQRLFVLFLFGAVDLTIAGPVTPIDALMRGEDGVYTIRESAVYLISVAGSTSITFCAYTT